MGIDLANALSFSQKVSKSRSFLKRLRSRQKVKTDLLFEFEARFEVFCLRQLNTYHN